MNLLRTDYNGCLEMRSFSFTSPAFTFLLEYLARRDCRGAELTSETDLGGRRPPRPPSATWLIDMRFERALILLLAIKNLVS